MMAPLPLPLRLLSGLALAVFLAGSAAPGRAAEEPPILAPLVETRELPPLAERLPETPYVDPLEHPWQEPGRYGGTLDMLMAKARDLRQMVVYGYARLVGYTPDLELQPDILESVEVEDETVFTLRLRPGHKWSDGHPFTSEDFRYWWEDVANNEELSPSGPPISLQVNDAMPEVSFPDEHTVVYRFAGRHPTFLHLLAGARPFYIYAPAHYLRQFHERYADPEKLAAMVEGSHQRNWAALHNRHDDMYKADNVDLPTLDPWMNTTEPPSERFVFARNPYFHRVDAQGRQLPYIDELGVQIAATGIIPAKTGAAETDLQARYLRFDNYTFLKQAETRGAIKVLLWETAPGAQIALYPNLNVEDPVYRELFRDVRFRRALSLAIDRHEINQVIFFGLGIEGNNTVLPKSPLYRPEYREKWARYDLKEANRLLDELGLEREDGDGKRQRPDGRPLDIIVETDGESSEETDALQLIRDSWAEAGIGLYIKSSQREVLRNRVFAGETEVSAGIGIENGLPGPAMSPIELVPARQSGMQWPYWGQYVETGGRAGQPPDMAVGKELMALHEAWRSAETREAREGIWHKILQIHADQVLSIGIVAGIPQPIVTAASLRNLPEEGLYNWDPGAFFGLYHPDTFWFDEAESE